MLAICLAAPAAASQLEIIDLHGTWKFRTGDNLSWAAMTLDETDWQEIDFAGWGDQGFPGYCGIAWYRRVFEVDRQEGVEIRPAILMGKVSSAYEIYVDGMLLGGVGALPPEPRYDYDRHALFRVPARAFDDGKVSIAIRIWAGPDLESTGGGPFEGSFLLGDELVLRDRMMRDEGSRIFFSLVFLLVGLAHLYLFRRGRGSSPYLWFGLLTLVTGAYTLLRSQWKYSLDLDFMVFKELEFLLVMISPALAAQFFWSLFGRPVPRILRAYQIGTVGLGLLVALTPGLRLNLLVLSPWLAVLMPVVIGMALFLLREAWRGRPEARGMAFGFSILVITVIHDSVAEQGWLPPSRWMPWGFAAFLLSMAVVLADRFSRIYAEVESLRDDLESRVKRQTALLEARTLEAQEASRAKSRFLATVSHELRSPLNSILGFTDILRRHDSPDGHERYVDFLDHIAKSGQHLLGLINDILDLSKIEAGKMEPQFEQVDLIEIVDGVCGVCQGVAGPNRVIIHKDIPDRVPPMILDPVMVKQILWNLVSNAVKFSAPGSEVTVALSSNGSGDGDLDDKTVSITVTDRGIGIAPEDHERIFDEFQQIDADTDRKYQGTGLGLALVRKLVDLHHGSISVVSELGKGSIFEVTLPLDAGPTVSSAPSSSEST